MFRLFKRAPAEPSFPEILVDEDTFSPGAHPADAVQSLVDYTNAIMHRALYKLGEFPSEAYSLYCADYYVAQVQNGGHSQYVGNRAALRTDTDMIAEARAGIALIGCMPLLRCLDDLKKWIAQNPLQAAKQNGFTVRADALDTLDKRFFEIGSDMYYAASRDWLRNSPLVRALPAKQLQTALDSASRQNPRYDSRMRTQRIAALDAGLTDDTLAVYRACVATARVHGEFFEIRRILGGDPRLHPAASDKGFDFAHPLSQVWTLETNTSDPLYGYIHDDTAHVAAKDPHGVLHSLVECPMDRVNRQIDVARTLAPGRFALELLARLAPDEEPLFLMFVDGDRTPEDEQRQRMFFGVKTKSGAHYTMMMQDNGATLERRADKNMLGKLTGPDFEALKSEDHSRLV